MPAEVVPPAEPVAPAGAGRGSGRTLLIQFFLLPALIAGACLLVFLGFGLLVHEQRGPRQVLQEVQQGGSDRRWQAAFELSKMLGDPKTVRRDPAFGVELIRAFEAARREQDPRARRFLALSLGKLGDPAASESLARALQDQDADTRLYALLGLGAVGGAGQAAAVIDQLHSEDRGLRKAAAYVLGRIGGVEAGAALRGALQDAVAEVRWNASIALLDLHDGAGLPTTLRLLERGYVSAETGILPAQIEAVLLEAIRAVADYGAPEAREPLRRLRGDPSPAVRAAALRALRDLPPAPSRAQASKRRPAGLT